MRVGVVCEGQTDVHAIEAFLGASLLSRGIDVVFVNLQPSMDRTNPTDGGWAMVLRWLIDNPPRTRSITYLSGGLFDADLHVKRCDVILVQMDADILSDCTFGNWVRNKVGREVVVAIDPVERGEEIRAIIETVGHFHELSPLDRSRHIVAPAVESTETWCVAAFQDMEGNPECATGVDLCQIFMTALHESEGRAIRSFARVNKDPRRRRSFCARSARGFLRLERQCYHYRLMVDCIASETVTVAP